MGAWIVASPARKFYTEILSLQKVFEDILRARVIGMSAGFYLGFIVWGRSPEWPKATSLGGPRVMPPPRKLF